MSKNKTEKKQQKLLKKEEKKNKKLQKKELRKTNKDIKKIKSNREKIKKRKNIFWLQKLPRMRIYIMGQTSQRKMPRLWLYDV